MPRAMKMERLLYKQAKKYVNKQVYIKVWRKYHKGVLEKIIIKDNKASYLVTREDSRNNYPAHVKKLYKPVEE